MSLHIGELLAPSKGKIASDSPRGVHGQRGVDVRPVGVRAATARLLLGALAHRGQQAAEASLQRVHQVDPVLDDGLLASYGAIKTTKLLKTHGFIMVLRG